MLHDAPRRPKTGISLLSLAITCEQGHDPVVHFHSKVRVLGIHANPSRATVYSKSSEGKGEGTITIAAGNLPRLTD